VTSKYWEEEDEIKFYIGDAAMGIEKDAVLDIKKSAKEPDRLRYEAEKPEKHPTEAESKPAVSGTPKADEKQPRKKRFPKTPTKIGILCRNSKGSKKSESRRI